MSSRCTLLSVAIALGASACMRKTAEPAVPLASERVESTPSLIAFVSSDRKRSGLSDAIRFGGPLGRSALYLKFPNEWRARGVPRRAFLTLSAREGSASSIEPIAIEAWRIDSDWQPRALERWSQKPSLALPFARTRIAPSATRELRIDVSEIVRFAAQNPEREFGIALIASGSAGPGASFSTGFAGGRAPRLELYLR